jgi:hypothetical protein
MIMITGENKAFPCSPRGKQLFTWHLATIDLQRRRCVEKNPTTTIRHLKVGGVSMTG